MFRSEEISLARQKHRKGAVLVECALVQDLETDGIGTNLNTGRTGDKFLGFSML